MDGSHTVPLSFTHDVQRHPGYAAVRPRDEVDDQGVLDYLDVRRRPDRRHEGALDLRTGRVPAGVGDPITQVATLARQGELAGVRVVELRTECDQLADRFGPFGDECANGPFVAQTRTGDERVVQVLLWCVPRTERSGDPALRPLGGARREDVLGDHEHGAHLASLQRRGQSCDARADDDDVGVRPPAGDGCQQSSRERCHPRNLAGRHRVATDESGVR